MLKAAREQLATSQQPMTSEKAGSQPRKRRVRNFSADDRAAHRIFEKNRRDAFRAQVLELAEELPTLAGQDPQRLSKHTVIDESIQLHRLQQSRYADAEEKLRALIKERDDLLAEVNTWRNISGLEPRSPVISDISFHVDQETASHQAQVSPDDSSRSTSSGPNINNQNQWATSTSFDPPAQLESRGDDAGIPPVVELEQTINIGTLLPSPTIPIETLPQPNSVAPGADGWRLPDDAIEPQSPTDLGIYQSLDHLGIGEQGIQSVIGQAMASNNSLALTETNLNQTSLDQDLNWSWKDPFTSISDLGDGRRLSSKAPTTLPVHGTTFGL